MINKCCCCCSCINACTQVLKCRSKKQQLHVNCMHLLDDTVVMNPVYFHDTLQRRVRLM